jgi:hypothetical protein
MSDAPNSCATPWTSVHTALRKALWAAQEAESLLSPEIAAMEDGTLSKELEPLMRHLDELVPLANRCRDLAQQQLRQQLMHEPTGR